MEWKEPVIRLQYSLTRQPIFPLLLSLLIDSTEVRIPISLILSRTTCNCSKPATSLISSGLSTSLPNREINRICFFYTVIRRTVS